MWNSVTPLDLREESSHLLIAFECPYLCLKHKGYDLKTSSLRPQMMYKISVEWALKNFSPVAQEWSTIYIEKRAPTALKRAENGHKRPDPTCHDRSDTPAEGRYQMHRANTLADRS